jgi:hypothetical protein
MDLLPPRPLVEIAEVLTDGATRYGEYNWAKGLKFSRLKAAMERHLLAWWAGEDLDPDSGRPHLAHLGCELLFAMDLRHTMPAMDDRPVGKVAPPFDPQPRAMEIGEDGIRFEDPDYEHFCNVVWQRAKKLDLPSGRKKVFTWSDLFECIHEVQRATPGMVVTTLKTLDDLKVAVEKIRRLDEPIGPTEEELKKARAMKSPKRSNVRSPKNDSWDTVLDEPEPKKRGRPRKMFTTGKSS